MTSPSTSAMTELLARVRAAQEPSRELDYAVYCEVIPKAFGLAPELTRSLDAAVALAERVLPGMRAQLVFGGGKETRATMLMADGPPTQRAATPALAMIAATLASLISKENEG